MAGKRRPWGQGQMLCMDFVAGEIFWFNATELVHCRLSPWLASSSSSLHIPFLPTSHCSLLPSYPRISAPQHVAWTLMASPPFPDCHGLPMAGQTCAIQRSVLRGACFTHSLHVSKHGLDTKEYSSLQTLKLFIAAANSLSGSGSQEVEVISEAPLIHEWHHLMEHPVMTEMFSICVLSANTVATSSLWLLTMVNATRNHMFKLLPPFGYYH